MAGFEELPNMWPWNVHFERTKRFPKYADSTRSKPIAGEELHTDAQSRAIGLEIFQCVHNASDASLHFFVVRVHIFLYFFGFL